jgi:integrase
MLTDTAIKNLKPKGKPYKKGDEGGLYLLVQPSGSKHWYMSYRGADRREKKLSFGAYGVVSLAKAREKRDAAKRLLADGKDPSEQKKAERREAGRVKPTFRFVAECWLKVKIVDEGKSNSTRVREERNIKVLNAVIGDMLASEIEPPDVLQAITPAQDAGYHETAKRLRLTASQIFQFGIPHGYCKRDAAADLTGAMTTVKSTPRPALVEAKPFGELLRDIKDYQDGRFDGLISLALQFLALVATRPGEMRLAKWREFDIEQARWSVPAERLKMRSDPLRENDPHIVPLSRQALAVLEKLRELTGERTFVFSASRDIPISDNTLNKALRIMGYDTQTEHCAHGFRSSFSHILNHEFRPDGEKVWHDDVIELQLCHIEGSTREIYKRTGPMSLMPQRINLMQHWADRIDIIRDGGNVVSMGRKRV